MKVIAFILLSAAAFAQTATSPGGFGRMSNPGGRPVTTGGGGFGRIIYPGTGAPVVSRNGTTFPATVVPGVNHGNHGVGVAVPYPVFVNSGFYDYDAPPVAVATSQYQTIPSDQLQSSPVIIINQYFRPDTANPVINDYSNTQLPQAIPYAQAQPTNQSAQAANPADNQPIMFLIAMKDHTIIPALAYWVDGDTLHYINTQGSQNSASVSLVDRDFSKQLNKDRNLDFGLPAKPENQ